jgi:hypothetical protein
MCKIATPELKRAAATMKSAEKNWSLKTALNCYLQAKSLMKNQTPTNVIVVIGAGAIGQAIARRVSAGKHVLLADLICARKMPMRRQKL